MLILDYYWVRRILDNRQKNKFASLFKTKIRQNWEKRESNYSKKPVQRMPAYLLSISISPELYFSFSTSEQSRKTLASNEFLRSRIAVWRPNKPEKETSISTQKAFNLLNVHKY